MIRRVLRAFEVVAVTPRVAAAAAAVCILAAPASLSAQVYMTQDEALELAFPETTVVERRTAYLSEEDLDRASELAGEGAEIEVGVLPYYVARAEGGAPVGVAYFDAHRVRTLPEVLMVVVDTEDRVRRVEVVRFAEPPEYLAPEGWMDQFRGRALDGDLSLKGEVVNITGATLTSRAVTAAVRKVLALHRVIRPFAEEAGDDGSARDDAGAPRPGGSR